MAENSFEIVIVGGGIVGLATARALLLKYPGCSLALLEKEKTLASHQTGRNSGVIHSGIYYKPGTFKARLCVEGGREMVEFCRENGVAHEITGKVVVATRESEIPQLEELLRRGTANGVPGLELIGPEGLKEIEPHAAGIKALRVPGSGIVDYGLVCQKLAGAIQKLGGEIKTQTEFLGAKKQGGCWKVRTSQGELSAKFLVNCGGLQSDRVTRRSGFKPPSRIIPFRGEYYRLIPEAEPLVKSLIYPVPNPLFPFLGVHFTQMVRGGVEAGPNAVLAFKREGYHKLSFNLWDSLETLAYPGFWKLAFRYGGEGMKEIYRSVFKSAFVKALQRLVPEIQSRHLVTGNAGVRAQALDFSGALVDDFKFVEAEGVLHVLNAPSPAATASLPIGREIAQRVVLD
ncbi:MAG TPA: L-2-hydroxyglutarate oxidase, partial [bacterium]|nr:L-2-hydroxyglutarate oxidase [bacterium]